MLWCVPRILWSSAGMRSSVRSWEKVIVCTCAPPLAFTSVCKRESIKLHRVKRLHNGVCVSVWMHWNEKGSQRAAISQVYLQHHPTNRRILHPASIKNRSLTLPPAKTPSAPPARPNRSKHTVKPTLTAPPCDTLLFRTGVSAWCPCGYCQRPQSSLHLFLKKFLNYGLFYIQAGALQASGLRRISQTQHSTHTVYAVEREREQASVIHARTQKAKKTLPATIT